MPPSTTSLGPCPPRADASATNPGMLRRVTRSWKQWFTLLNRRRLLTRTVASIERSPSVVALDGPYTHDNIYVRGVRLHAAVAGSPSDPLILLIHGAFGGWFDYKDVIAPLAARGFHVAAVDMRGYGLSDKPPSGYELRRCAGDINGVIAALGHDCALLVGTDTGGSVAWTVSTMYPERVSGVVSLGAVHPVDLRRAIRRKPYLFGPLIKRITLFHLPVFILRGLRRAIPARRVGKWSPAPPPPINAAMPSRTPSGSVRRPCRSITPSPPLPVTTGFSSPLCPPGRTPRLPIAPSGYCVNPIATLTSIW